MAGEAAAHVQAAFLRGERLKAVAADCVRLIHSPSTGTDVRFEPDPIMQRPFPLLCCALASASLAFGQDLLVPPFSLQSLTATDGSTQTSLVFKSLPGVLYQFEASDDLLNWSPVGDPFYALGHEHACALLETAVAPPPPEPPGGDPPDPEPEPVHATLVVSPAAGGGVVATWRSLENQSLLSRHAEISLDPAWTMVPLYFQKFGNHTFFIMHQMADAPVPEDESELVGADALMWAALVDALPEMNQEVAANYQLALAAPPAAPPDPGALRFLRVRADGDVDSDHDGTPDWMEFAYEPDPNAPDGPVGNPFNPDTDDDGLPDGLDLDFDGDGTPDIEDAVHSDRAIYWARSSAPKYAVFPLNGAIDPYGQEESPIVATDGGAVLYSSGVWKEGAYHGLNLARSFGVGMKYCVPLSMNAYGQILGWGNHISQVTPYEKSRAEMCWWVSPDAAPQRLLDNDSEWAGVSPQMLQTPGNYRQALTNDRKFIAELFEASTGENGEDTITSKGERIWSLPAMAGNATYDSSSVRADGLLDISRYWWHEGIDKTTLQTADSGLKEFDTRIREFVPLPEGGLAAVPTSEEAIQISGPGVDWMAAGSLPKCRDICALGWAIVPSTSEPLWFNGLSSSLKDAAPEISGNWAGADVKLTNLSNSGALVMQKPRSQGGFDYALGIPLVISDDEFATGVDAVSVTSSEPGDACEDRLWVMAPAGGSNTFHLQTTAGPGSELTLESPGGFVFGGSAEHPLDSFDNTVTISAPATAISADHAVTIKSGDATALSKPLGVKVMKRRTVKVNVWRVSSFYPNMGTSGVSAPPIALTKQQIDDYLNDVYLNQINADFDATVIPVTVEFDSSTPEDQGYEENPPNVGGEGAFDTTNQFGIEATSVRDALSANLQGSTAAIEIFLLGGVVDGVTHPAAGSSGFSGKTDIDRRHCWLVAGSGATTAVLSTMAHEIGHVLVGPGHPDHESGPCPLPGTDRTRRLMCSGLISQSDGILLVKGEWDACEEKLSEIIDE